MIYDGVDLFTIAKVIEDTGERYEAETPVMLPVSFIDIPEEGSYTPVYKDGEVINAYAIGIQQEIKVNTKAIAPEFLNDILNGKEEPAFFDTGINDTNFYALGFRLSLYDGSYTYYSYLKGTIKVNSKSIETKQGTIAVVESITFNPLTTRHKFTYNGKPCRKVEVNTNKHKVFESGWLAIVWTPDNFLPVPAPIVEATATEGNIKITMLSLRNSDTVRYTLDGTTPTLDSEVYSEPILLNGATTVKAIECATSKHTSAVSTLVLEVDTLAYGEDTIGYGEDDIAYMFVARS